MRITRAITVKARVTAGFRSRLGVEIQKAIKEIDGQLSSSMEKGKIEELSSKRQSLVGKLRDIADLGEGQEVVIGQIEGCYDVKVGDNWGDIHQAEIVLEDGIVVALREGKTVSSLTRDADDLKGVEGDRK